MRVYKCKIFVFWKEGVEWCGQSAVSSEVKMEPRFLIRCLRITLSREYRFCCRDICRLRIRYSQSSIVLSLWCRLFTFMKNMKIAWIWLEVGWSHKNGTIFNNFEGIAWSFAVYQLLWINFWLGREDQFRKHWINVIIRAWKSWGMAQISIFNSGRHPVFSIKLISTSWAEMWCKIYRTWNKLSRMKAVCKK